MTQPQAARPEDDTPQFREIEAAEATPAAPSRELLEQVVRRILLMGEDKGRHTAIEAGAVIEPRADIR